MRKLEDVLAEENRPDERDLRSRTDARKVRKDSEQRLSHLAAELVELSEKKLSLLGLPEAVLDSVLDARRITSSIARTRQLRIVRRALREHDPDAVAQKLEALIRPRGRGPTPPKSAPAEVWTARLIREGDPALDALLIEFPHAERARLRTLLRNAKGSAERRARASRGALVAALSELLDTRLAESGG